LQICVSAGVLGVSWEKVHILLWKCEVLMTKSIWLSYTDDTNFPALKNNIKVDAVIIGGGITGITTAQLLSRKGLRVAVLEKGKVGTNSTGHSTGNLYSAVSEILLNVRKKFGDDVTEMVVNSRREAIDHIEDNVKSFLIDCDFKRVTWNYYSTLTQTDEKIEKAFEAAKKIKMQVVYSDLPETKFTVKKAIKVEGAAQFNPLRYVQGLAKSIESDNCIIFENSEVREFQENEKGVTVKTSNGSVVEADYLIHATHTPKGIMTFHTELGPYREYGIACKMKGKHPEGVYFGYYVSAEITSTRSYERGGDHYLIVVGGPHKVGHGDNLSHLNRLEKFAKDHFDIVEVTHRWAAQNYKALDNLPYIGAKSEGSRIYIGTGYSSHGLTYGTVAAQVISDQITGVSNPYSEIYRPNRFTPLKSAPKFIKENFDVFMSFVKDYVLKRPKDNFSDIAIGEGKVVEEEGHKLAVYRNEHQGLQICSAVCSHMGCIVHWNNAESSWDCPCHGSRFDTRGEVIEGPALKALASLSELTAKNGLLKAYGNNVSGETPDMRDHSERTDQQHVMSDDEMLDETCIESFPASDPPGHFSRSQIDNDQHQREF
jgi:glycine/D-amino acid oxidase-like deaminating enzyme/nitrite reductase/ring-hydroxylating ferredoxin subunit